MAYTTIDDSSAHYQTALYTGNGGTLAVTNDGNSDLQPDFIWAKNRDRDGYHHNLYDSTRGVSKQLFSNLANDEDDQANGLASFNSDGFTLGSDDSSNYNGDDYVAWQWKANGGTTTTNDASATGVGSIDSVYQANTTAGFSIVTHTGTGANGTIAHGLGTTPRVVLLKCRSNDGASWMMFHTGMGNNAKTLSLEEPDAETTESDPWYSFANTAPTSTVFSVGAGNTTNGSSRTFVTYCFSEVQGYSKLGSYTGNGAQDGTFVYTGFKPAWIMAKRTDASKNWYIFDSTRSPTNVHKAHLVANSSAAEDDTGDATDSYFDVLSNGFKLRQDFSHLNADGGTHIYMAFAEQPFVTSGGVPCTAR